MEGCSMTKQEIRVDALEKRRALLPDQRSLFNMLIFERAHKDRKFQLAKRVHVYRSTDEEVDTSLFFEYAWGIGKEVYTPYVDSTSAMMHVKVDRNTQWEVGPFGVLQPVVDASTDVGESHSFDETTAVVAPLVAFDTQCNRLGFGKGFYDQFLSECAAHTIGLGYECQRVDHVLIEQHDIPLLSIASEERWYRG